MKCCSRQGGTIILLHFRIASIICSGQGTLYLDTLVGEHAYLYVGQGTDCPNLDVQTIGKRRSANLTAVKGL